MLRGRVSLALPEAGVEGALDGFGAVAAAFGDGVDGAFLFERVSSGEGSEPASGSGEGFAAASWFVRGRHVVRELERVPGDGAAGAVEEALEALGAVRADVGVGVLVAVEQGGREDVEAGCGAGAADGVDRAARVVAAGGVVVEGEGEGLDPSAGEVLDVGGVDAGAADGGDVRDPAGSEVVDVEEAFDEDQPASIWRAQVAVSPKAQGGCTESE